MTEFNLNKNEIVEEAEFLYKIQTKHKIFAKLSFNTSGEVGTCDFVMLIINK